MEIIRLTPGRDAGIDEDCIWIQQLPGGQLALEGSVLVLCDEDAPVSESLIESDVYDSYEAAEAGGLAWAAERGVATLFVCRSRGTETLRKASSGFH